MRKLILLGLLLLCGCSGSRSYSTSSNVEERREVIIDSETTLLPKPTNC